MLVYQRVKCIYICFWENGDISEIFEEVAEL